MYKAREAGARAFALRDDELNMRDDELTSSGVAGFPRAAGMLWGVTRACLVNRGNRGRRSEVLGNGGYCRIGELPGTPDSGQGQLGNMRLTAVGKVCDT